ncbi:sigma-70 family RNA polymerase sigma factor [Parabacteroides acidifaciens]|uniref:Sigma-70 family RNA polymerase sigma factor n=1 Tax=Parabacteroides acidifaciens TaxID=2290935 RepID=A0A3D8HG89_9BACT|nr:sigma-70 family RNA polymerase sigma factor [Parabacteroides acidifaciens]MBC8601754.1 sigma-70 family RNA polymerase sigma factor [Parabacteroides acidifaciens]RDU49587.1 sigma-70 family RNA polymerase sigma factor [Parabacteroides acidifaciens]
MWEDESKIKWDQFLAGDNNAYSWIYKAHIQMLFRYGRRFTSDTELIKDCIQDVFTGLYKNRKQLITPRNIKVYLLISIKNSLVNALYREDRYTPYDSEAVPFALGLSVEEQYLDNEQYANQQKKIQEILNILTPRQKEIIYYRYIQELSFDEICTMMDMNYQSAQNLIQRSLKKIREEYGSPEIFLLILTYLAH